MTHAEEVTYALAGLTLPRKRTRARKGEEMSRLRVRLIPIGSVILITTLFLISGCGQKENEKLRAENDWLTQELAELKERADSHYQQGVDFLAASRYQEAETEFKTVIEKYPSSPLVTSANQQLKKAESKITKAIAKERAEEARRREEEKYRPRSAQQAIAEWKKFRNNEKTYKGTVTTWRLKVYWIFSDKAWCWINSVPEYKVAILGPKGLTYQAGVMLGKVPEIHDNDWIVVTGKFEYVSSDGYVVLSSIRVKNEGFR